MPTILNTGAGLYQPTEITGYDPARDIKEFGEMSMKLMEAEYTQRKQREKEFLEMTDIKSVNMMNDTLQKEAAKRQNEFIDFAVDIEAKYKGKEIPLDERIKIRNKQRDIEQWQSDRLNQSMIYQKSQQLLLDSPDLYDFNDSTKNLDEFNKDPLNKVVKPLVHRYKSVDEIHEEIYKRRGNVKKTEAVIKGIPLKDGWKLNRKVIERDKLETPEQRMATWEEEFASNNDYKRTMNHEWLRKLSDEDRQKYPTTYDYAKRFYAPQFGKETVLEEQYLKDDTEKENKKPSGISSKKTLYATQTNVTDKYTGKLYPNAIKVQNINNKSLGEAISITGQVFSQTKTGKEEPLDMTSQDLIDVTEIFADRIVGNTYKGSMVIDEEAKKLFNKDRKEDPSSVEVAIQKGIWDNLKTGTKHKIFYKNGELYLSKPLEERTVSIPITDPVVRNNAFNQLTNSMTVGAKNDFYAEYAKLVPYKEDKESTPTKKKLY